MKNMWLKVKRIVLKSVKSNLEKFKKLKGLKAFRIKAATSGVLSKKVFLEMRPATLLKRDSGTSVFLWILRNF